MCPHSSLQDINISIDMWPATGVELQANVTLLGPTAEQAAAAGIEYSMLELNMGLVSQGGREGCGMSGSYRGCMGS
jgi:hypothetical protein